MTICGRGATMSRMPKKVVMVGHCGPDSSYLRLAVSRAVRDVSIVAADDESSLNKAIAGGVDLVLMNRQLDWGFTTDEGVELIRQLKAEHPSLKLMMVSNYEEAQEAAVGAGALRGFGKRELSTPRVAEVLRAALE